MRHDELTDSRLDEALRRQPRWDPPRHFARAVVARLPPADDMQPSIETSRLPDVVRAVATGAAGAILTYVAGTVIVRTTPLLVANAELVAWMGAAAGLLIAAAVTGLAQEWI